MISSYWLLIFLPLCVFFLYRFFDYFAVQSRDSLIAWCHSDWICLWSRTWLDHFRNGPVGKLSWDGRSGGHLSGRLSTCRFSVRFKHDERIDHQLAQPSKTWQPLKPQVRRSPLSSPRRRNLFNVVFRLWLVFRADRAARSHHALWPMIWLIDSLVCNQYIQKNVYNLRKKYFFLMKK